MAAAAAKGLGTGDGVGNNPTTGGSARLPGVGRETNDDELRAGGRAIGKGGGDAEGLGDAVNADDAEGLGGNDHKVTVRFRVP